MEEFQNCLRIQCKRRSILEPPRCLVSCKEESALDDEEKWTISGRPQQHLTGRIRWQSWGPRSPNTCLEARPTPRIPLGRKDVMAWSDTLVQLLGLWLQSRVTKSSCGTETDCQGTGELWKDANRAGLVIQSQTSLATASSPSSSSRPCQDRHWLLCKIMHRQPRDRLVQRQKGGSRLLCNRPNWKRL